MKDLLNLFSIRHKSLVSYSLLTLPLTYIRIYAFRLPRLLQTLIHRGKIHQYLFSFSKSLDIQHYTKEYLSLNLGPSGLEQHLNQVITEADQSYWQTGGSDNYTCTIENIDSTPTDQTRYLNINVADNFLSQLLSESPNKPIKDFILLWSSWVLGYPVEESDIVYSLGISRGRNSNSYLHSDCYYPLVKGFVYLTDVDASMGPFEYASGSTSISELASIHSSYTQAISTSQTSPSTLSPRITSSNQLTSLEASIKSFSGPIGTLVLADTHGVHRKGHHPSADFRKLITFEIRRHALFHRVKRCFTHNRHIKNYLKNLQNSIELQQKESQKSDFPDSEHSSATYFNPNSMTHSSKPAPNSTLHESETKIQITDERSSLLKLLFSLSDFTFADIGAAKGPTPLWSQVLSEINLLGVEPDPRSSNIPLPSIPKSTFFISDFLWSKRDKLDFHFLVKFTCSSIYKPNYPLLNKFPYPSRFAINDKSPVEVVPLDEVDHPYAKINFFKLDTQGSELNILLGAEKHLSMCLGIESEVEFQELYDSQPLFSDVDHYLRNQGFEFIDFISLNRWERAVHNGRGQLISGDALWLRSPEYVVENMPDYVNQYIAICCLYGKYDLAETVLSSASLSLPHLVHRSISRLRQLPCITELEAG